MKKITLFAAGFFLTLGCSWGDPDDPAPTPSPSVRPVQPIEQKCFDDAVVALRETQKTHQYKRPDSCNDLPGGEHRYWEIHEMALLKVTANG